MPFKIIVAFSKKNRVIGLKGKIPWRLPKDFAHFKKTTDQCVVVMGRVTYENLGSCGLPNRHIIVVTKTNTYGWDDMLLNDGKTLPMRVSIFDTEDKIKTLDGLATKQDVWIAGGQKIYEMFLPKCSEVIASEVEGDFEGDCFMPEFKFKSEQTVATHEGFEIKKFTL